MVDVQTLTASTELSIVRLSPGIGLADLLLDLGLADFSVLLVVFLPDFLLDVIVVLIVVDVVPGSLNLVTKKLHIFKLTLAYHKVNLISRD